MRHLVTNVNISRMVVSKSVLVLEVGFAALWIRLHWGIARPPTSWTDLTMFIGKLKCLNETQCFVHRASYWKIVDCNLSQVSFIVDNEQSSERDTCNRSEPVKTWFVCYIRWYCPQMTTTPCTSPANAQCSVSAANYLLFSKR